jgi:hypothetical protein
MIDKLPGQRLHMPSITNALAKRPEAGVAREDDYQAFCAALETSARGRWFLSEYARRNRTADTQILLDALARLEARIAADGTAAERLRAELRMLLIAIRLARPEIDAAAPSARAVKLGGLLDLLEYRIDAMAETKTVGTPADAALRSMPGEHDTEIMRALLAVVPPPDEPELPIPTPAAQAPAIALVDAGNPGSAAIIPAVSPFQNATPAAVEDIAVPAGAIAEPTPPPPAAAVTDEEVWTSPAAKLPPADDPLAAIKALSAEERLALFT